MDTTETDVEAGIELELTSAPSNDERSVLDAVALAGNVDFEGVAGKEPA